MKQQQPLNRVAAADFQKYFEKLSYRHSYSDTFNHFLDFALWMLDPYKDSEPVLYLEKVYNEKEGAIFVEMFNAWIQASDNNGNGFFDVLGDIFMEFVSGGRNGQFFTPQPICDMMAFLTYGDQLKPGQTVSDPACGSGRMLLAMGKMERRLKFYGADNDLTCCKMAALNMIINSMEGEIAHMNTLSLEYYRSYHIKVYNIKGSMIPFYFVSNNRKKSALL